MIEIKCSKAQFYRIKNYLMSSGLIDGKCVLGKNEFNCHFVRGNVQTCTECLKKNIVRKEDEGNEKFMARN